MPEVLEIQQEVDEEKEVEILNSTEKFDLQQRIIERLGITKNKRGEEAREGAKQDWLAANFDKLVAEVFFNPEIIRLVKSKRANDMEEAVRLAIEILEKE